MHSSRVNFAGLIGIHTSQNILVPLDHVIVYSEFKRSATISIFQGEAMLGNRGEKAYVT